MRLEILRTATPDPELADECAIGIMIKAPRPGVSKTRLSPPLTPAEAADISRCFLRDTASSIATLARMNPRVSGIAVYTPIGSEEELSELLPSDFKLIPQRAEGFGERLSGAVEDLFSAGYGAVCLLDSESPNLPLAVFENLVTMLFEFEDNVVVGPCVDGGYYAIGLRRPHRRVFEEIAWSTEQVYRETLERAAEINLPVTTLPVWYDIDDQISLQQLLVDLFERQANNETSPPGGTGSCNQGISPANPADGGRESNLALPVWWLPKQGRGLGHPLKSGSLVVALHLNRRQPRFFEFAGQFSWRARVIISRKRQYQDIVSTRVSGR